jgi:uncharacterized protein
MEITAVLIGFFGSLHCAAMCSPLSFAVTRISHRAFLNRALYNGGRILTYSLFGALFSAAGGLLRIDSMQNILSIILGLILLSFGVAKSTYLRIPFLTPAVQLLTILIKKEFSLLFSKKTSLAVFLLGMVNGVLPCGLSFLALAYCITLRGPIDGFVFMFLFGLSTLPAMLGGASALAFLVQRLKFKPAIISSNLLILSGITLLVRVFWSASVEAHETGEKLIDIVLCR